MCHHFTSPRSITRSHSIKRVGQHYSEGSGNVCTITYVRAIRKGVYQGLLSDGKPFTMTRAAIRASPKTYQLHKQSGHHNCYRLVCKAVERYREVKDIRAACGPKQRDMPNRAKTVYHLCNGEKVTDLELKEDEDCQEYDVVSIKDSDGEATRKYLSELRWVPSDDAAPSDQDED